jgi:hypothetical protein
MMPASIQQQSSDNGFWLRKLLRRLTMVNLQLTRDQFSVLFDMMVFYIASTERSPAREEMIEVQRTIQVQADEQGAHSAVIPQVSFSPPREAIGPERSGTRIPTTNECHLR